MSMNHALPGLETDNLLGFLALLGLLRANERERPEWFPRAHFVGTPLRTQLTLAQETTWEQIATIAAAGCIAYARYFDFGDFKDLTFNRGTARILLQKSLRDTDAASIMSALCSDGAARDSDDERVLPTALCAMFGQGHQSFLARLRAVAAGTLPRALKEKKNPPNQNDAGFVKRALFEPWTRSDETESFRWDFEEDRRYALREINPSSDPATTEHGANRLAVLGLVSFQSAPTTTRRGYANLGTRGVSRDGKTRRPRVTWPIWSRPASLESIHVMLDEYQLGQDNPSFEALARHSIQQARRVRRISVGKFISFTRAEALIP